MIRLLIVDDHAVVRSGLRSLLTEKHQMQVVGEASDGDEAIALSHKLLPDVVLMDLSMPHGKDGLTATAELKEQLPQISVLILSMHDDDEYLFRAINTGASGYVLKSAPYDELITAITSVAAGSAYLHPTATKRLMGEYLDQMKNGASTSTFETLSEREKEVVSLIAKGYSNKEISELLFISVKTVETHKSNLMEKLGFKTRPELVKYAMEKGLLNFE